MCIFYTKSLRCGCKIIACHFRTENNCIILGNHSYKWFCNKCMNLSDNELDNKLNKIKNSNNFNKIYGTNDYINYNNGWNRTASSPIDYFIPNESLVFGVDYY